MSEQKSKLRKKFLEELDAARKARRSGNSEQEWGHLERAHILGQFQSLKHFYVHILMMRFSIVHFKVYEFLGQIPRILLAVPGSLAGLAPKGNTGGSNVGIFKPMVIPEDLVPYLENNYG